MHKNQMNFCRTKPAKNPKRFVDILTVLC